MTAPGCIILAGGLGTRLRSVLPDKPKCLAPIGARSFLRIQLESLHRQGISCFVLSLGYLAELVQHEADILRQEKDIPIQTIIETTPLGTGGAVLLAMTSMEMDEVLVSNGDTFLGGSLTEMLKPLALSAGEIARIAVVEVANKERYGEVLMEARKVIGFSEKGHVGPGMINAGLYRIHRTAFAGQNPGDAFSLESVILSALAIKGNLSAALIRGEFTDIGVPEDYRDFCRRHG